MKTSRKGFTLIELLLVIGIIAILAAIVIVAINPTRQLGQARNAQRNSDVNTVLNAVWQYAIDNNGTMPTDYTDADEDVDETWRMLGSDTSACDITAADAPAGATRHCQAADITSMDDRCINLGAPLEGTYVVGIPTDPRYGPTTGTGKSYYIIKNANNRVTVRACYTEADASVLEVQR